MPSRSGEPDSARTPRTPRTGRSITSKSIVSEPSDQTFADDELPITSVTQSNSDRVFGPDWAIKKHEVLCFRSDRYQLRDAHFLRDLKLDNLHTLDLAGNQLKELHNLDRMSPYLRILNLSHNRLTDFIASFVRLEELHLDHNDLTLLPPVMGCPKLRILDLSHNHIRPMKFDPFQNLHFLQTLDVSHNRFDCDPVRFFEICINFVVSDIFKLYAQYNYYIYNILMF